MIAAVRPALPAGHGRSWDALAQREHQTRDRSAKDGLSIVNIEEPLARSQTVVPYRTVHRFAVERCGFRVKVHNGAGRGRGAWSVRSPSRICGSCSTLRPVTGAPSTC